MSFSGRVLKELQKELQDLRKTRDVVVARIDALEVLLVQRRGSVAPRVDVNDVANASRVKVGSLRSNILRILEQVPAAGATDVTRQLEAEGFRVGGSTTLRERVAHELSRLRRKGVIQRTPLGSYERSGTVGAGLDEQRSPSAEDALAMI